MENFIGEVLAIFQALSDFVWEFPTNFAWYSELPIIGKLPLVILLLVGTGVYFSLSLRFVQIRYFRSGLQTLIHGRNAKNGISPLASFLLSTAMRVGPGNILGVTGAVSTGGPGALFLDVAFGIFWNGYGFCRVDAVTDIQEQARRRLHWRNADLRKETPRRCLADRCGIEFPLHHVRDSLYPRARFQRRFRPGQRLGECIWTLGGLGQHFDLDIFRGVADNCDVLGLRRARAYHTNHGYIGAFHGGYLRCGGARNGAAES